MFLEAFVSGPFWSGTQRVRDALAAGGASLLGERPLGGLRVVFTIELERGGAPLAAALDAAAVILDQPSRATLLATAATAEPLPATLGVTFLDGDPDARSPVPAVPG